ncbi:Sensor kinase protein RcsC [Xenorhabdus poinarii G6]|uniref:Sensor histidine kinase RcsC n=2 Tax=Xenorhabdus poinarii TaxID=40577 RepID=A0A068R0D4_9GAMM|nr:Sensor kinase protein RcsC [Xenorhabdus poinarii G6]
MLWALGILLTSFYLSNIFNAAKSDIRQEYNSNYDMAFAHIRYITSTLRDVQSMTENFLSKKNVKEIIVSPTDQTAITAITAITAYVPLITNSNCQLLRQKKHDYLTSVSTQLLFWKTIFASTRTMSQIFFVDTSSMCLVNLFTDNNMNEPDKLKKLIYEHTNKLIKMKAQGKEQTLFWILPNTKIDTGTLYAVTPVYVDGKMIGIVGVETTISLENFLYKKYQATQVMLLSERNQPVLVRPAKNNIRSPFTDIKSPYFGYDENITSLVLIRRLAPSSLYIAYSFPLKSIYDELKTSIMHSIVLNIISTILIFFFIWLFERKMFSPAQENAIRLEENEQFNHKIVASAPVGISILRVSDGANILSNELAHNYTRMLTHDDQKRIIDIICDKTSSYIDVVTNNNNHLQISFVHSRYRNEEVAICVLIDVSSRVKMEKSLQEMASAAEQANQAKSMFLATVSHELRTPLYGIIGNLELMQSHSLLPESARLLATMNNSSSLLLKIISDILDFSKIESNQLKIEPKDFNCREIVSHVIANYLPLTTKKGLGLYCYIDPDVPDSVLNDPVRLQQIIANLLNNAIKFTATGCVIIEMTTRHGYLYLSIKDTGIGIEDKLQLQLFEPFFQISGNKENTSHGTGLGLAICEKLINLMDGDIEFISQKHIGSIFSIRIPLYSAKYHTKPLPNQREKNSILLDIHNRFLENYLLNFLTQHHFHVMLYDGKKTDGTEIFISDQEKKRNMSVRGFIVISEKHIDPPAQIRKNYWLYNTYELSKLDTMLDNLFTEHPELPAIPALTLPISAKTIQTDHRLNKIKVLVVDDHPINQNLLVDQLSSLGFSASMANDGLDAIEYLKNNPVDIILTDVNMPNMDGYELTQYLRNKGYPKSIIGVTANALAKGKQRCVDAGMNDCLSKPVSLAMLKETLMKYSDI